jgi:hypothetical protein
MRQLGAFVDFVAEHKATPMLARQQAAVGEDRLQEPHVAVDEWLERMDAAGERAGQWTQFAAVICDVTLDDSTQQELQLRVPAAGSSVRAQVYDVSSAEEVYAYTTAC